MAMMAIASVAVESLPSDNGGDAMHRSPLAHTTPLNASTINRLPRTSSVYASSPMKKPDPYKADQDQEQPTEWGRNFWVTLVDPQVRDHESAVTDRVAVL